MGALLSILWFVDILLLGFAVESILIEGPTVMIMFASEVCAFLDFRLSRAHYVLPPQYMILLAMVWSTTMKYALNVVDLRSEVPWEEKSIYVFYVDLATDFFKLVTYVSFFGLILTFYGLPLNILRDVYLTFRSFILKCRDLRRYRQATRNMDSLYPDATAEEMENMVDKTCIICREDMEYRGPQPVPAAPGAVDGEAPPPPRPQPAQPAPPRSGPNDTPKKLPCGHVFHFHCLRSWLERQQSCPTCRRPVLASDQARAQAAAAAAAAAVPPARGGPPVGDDVVRQAQINLARNLGREAFAVVFPGLPFPPEAGGPAIPGAQAGGLAPPPREQGTPPVGRGTLPNELGVDGGASASGSGSSGGPSRTASGQDNPLARFSLPDYRLPPSGEAGLYGHPPGHPSHPPPGGWRGVAYGGYPSSSSRPGQPSSPTATHAARVPNLEERLATIRTRMAQAAATLSPANLQQQTQARWVGPIPPPPTAPVDASEASGRPVGTDATSTSTPPSSTSDDVAPNGLNGSPVEKGTVESSTPPRASPSPRQAALEAAERRAGRVPTPEIRSLPSSEITGRRRSTSVDYTAFKNYYNSIPTIPGATPTQSPSPVSFTDHKSTPTRSTAPTGYPRLIPLFNPDSPLATSYPNLLASMPPALTPPFFDTPRPLSSQPLVPSSPTEDQLRELSQLTRAGIEERLRVLVGFQDRMASLAADMGQVLSVLPADPPQLPKTAEMNTTVETKVDKGKRPVEGVNAVRIPGSQL
ncbi:E3 ubiquitin-protein ligase synoviolin, partial [Phenoliferia sp. Uapishka_3]